MSDRKATAAAGVDQERSTASTDDARDATARELVDRRQYAASIARIAHWLTNDRGYTKAMASTELAMLARKVNRGQWSDEEMRLLLGDASGATNIRSDV